MTNTEIVDGEVMESTVAALATRPAAGALVEPAAPIEAIEQAFRSYQHLCQRLLTDDDYQTIRQWNAATRSYGDKKFPKRSAWRKLSVAFGVTYEIVKETVERGEDDRVKRASFIVRATAPNGRFSDGWGNCDVRERCCEPGCSKGGNHKHCSDVPGSHETPASHFSHAEHDIPATAETRAKNRAAADLFGMGQVSAEEVVSEVSTQRQTRTRASKPQSDGPASPQEAAGDTDEGSPPPTFDPDDPPRTMDQQRTIYRIAGEKGLRNDVPVLLRLRTPRESTKYLTYAEAETVIEFLTIEPAESLQALVAEAKASA